MNESFVKLAKKYGLTVGSTWINLELNMLIVIIDNLYDENNQEIELCSNEEKEKEWCHALCIPTTIGVVYEKYYFWPYLIGLAKNEKITKIA